jgi:hypothetical protein
MNTATNTLARIGRELKCNVHSDPASLIAHSELMLTEDVEIPGHSEPVLLFSRSGNYAITSCRYK